MDEQENQKDENIHLRRFLRVLANFLITCSLGGSGYLIYFVVKRSQEFATRDDLSWYEKNEVTTVVEKMRRSAKTRERCFNQTVVLWIPR